MSFPQLPCGYYDIRGANALSRSEFSDGRFLCLAFSNLECLVRHKEICMSQHYLLSSKSKTLNIKTICCLTEEEAFHLLKTYRWGNPNVMSAVRIAASATKPTFLLLVNVGAANTANAISTSSLTPLSLFIN